MTTILWKNLVLEMTKKKDITKRNNKIKISQKDKEQLNDLNDIVLISLLALKMMPAIQKMQQNDDNKDKDGKYMDPSR